MRVQHICIVGKEAIEWDGRVRDGLTNTSHQNILHTRYRVAINSKVDLLLSAKSSSWSLESNYYYSTACHHHMLEREK